MLVKFKLKLDSPSVVNSASLEEVMDDIYILLLVSRINACRFVELDDYLAHLSVDILSRKAMFQHVKGRLVW